MSEFMNAEKMKEFLNLKVDTDNRTLNKYVKKGVLEIKVLSAHKKLYRLKDDFISPTPTTEMDLDFSF